MLTIWSSTQAAHISTRQVPCSKSLGAVGVLNCRPENDAEAAKGVEVAASRDQDALCVAGPMSIAYDESCRSFNVAAIREADLMATMTPSSEPAETTGVQGNSAVPPLENGDRLTRAEFERRYEAMPELKKAELIEGEVYMPSPVRQRYHGRQHSHLILWLTAYEGSTPGVEVGADSTVRLDLDNMPQPDCLLFVQPEHAGRVRIGDDGYIDGAPDLVAEVASSSASHDLGKKLNAYRRNGVREYVVWRVWERQIDWFALLEDRYEPLEPAADGILRSTVFPGLWLDSTALIRGDVNAVVAILQQGLNSPEHADFVARLERARVT
jgi:Uma2 family endonuclease